MKVNVFLFKEKIKTKKKTFFLQGQFLLLNLVAVVHLMINPEHTVNKKKLSFHHFITVKFSEIYKVCPDFTPNPSLTLTLMYLVGLSMSFRVTSCHSYSSSLLHKKLEMPAGCKAKVKTIRINSLTIYGKS